MDAFTPAPDQVVLLSPGILFEFRGNVKELQTAVEAVTAKIEEAVRDIVRDEPSLSSTGRMAGHYLFEETVNAKKCEACGIWASDIERPERLHEILPGWHVGNRFLCSPCALLEEER